MSIPFFTVFQDEDITTTLHTSLASSSKISRLEEKSSLGATKENINPLTGLSFDAQPPSKKRKPSSSSALKVKALAASSKPTSKSKKLLVSSNSKDKGKKRSILGLSENRNKSTGREGAEDAQELCTALGNRRAYELTVMPLANVTQAYDESEATRHMTRVDECVVENMDFIVANTIVHQIRDETDVTLCDATTEITMPALLSEQ